MRIVGIVVLLLAATGCSSAEEPVDVTSAPQTLQVVGLDSVAWETTELGVRAGTVDVTLVCGAGVGHGLAIDGVLDGTGFATCAGGEASTATVDLETGTYTFFCTVPGHREAGMEGTLNVS